MAKSAAVAAEALHQANDEAVEKATAAAKLAAQLLADAEASLARVQQEFESLERFDPKLDRLEKEVAAAKAALEEVRDASRAAEQQRQANESLAAESRQAAQEAAQEAQAAALRVEQADTKAQASAEQHAQQQLYDDNAEGKTASPGDTQVGGGAGAGSNDYANDRGGLDAGDADVTQLEEFRNTNVLRQQRRSRVHEVVEDSSEAKARVWIRGRCGKLLPENLRDLVEILQSLMVEL